jgi:hypothetical protein
MTTQPGPPPPPDGAPPGGAVAGLAREVETLRRRVDQLQSLPRRIEQLAELFARQAETVAAAAGPAAPAPTSWLDLPIDPDRPAESSSAVRAAEELITGLAGWVGGVYLRYPDAAQTLPECWLWHPEVVEELIWLHSAWLAAHRPGASSTAVGDWHDRQRPGVVRRIRDYAGLCSLEQHQPSVDRHAPAPLGAVTDAVPAIAEWWATRRTDPPPAPTPAQLDAARRHEPRPGRR